MAGQLMRRELREDEVLPSVQCERGQLSSQATLLMCWWIQISVSVRGT